MSPQRLGERRPLFTQHWRRYSTPGHFETQLNRPSNLALSLLPIMNIKVSFSRQIFPPWCLCG